MTRRELVEELAASRGLSIREARRFLEAFLRTVERALTEGETVSLRSFGSFEVRRRAGRRVRPPGAARDVMVPARLTPAFRPSPVLTRRIGTGGEGGGLPRRTAPGRPGAGPR